eukprot:7795893-Lingulodinium_polyedra.AAC.1
MVSRGDPPRAQVTQYAIGLKRSVGVGRLIARKSHAMRGSPQLLRKVHSMRSLHAVRGSIRLLDMNSGDVK